MKINEGVKVTWTTASGVKGSGVCLTEVCPQGPLKGHTIVAVDNAPGEEHRVIWCAETWLTVVEGQTV